MNQRDLKQAIAQVHEPGECLTSYNVRTGLLGRCPRDRSFLDILRESSSRRSTATESMTGHDDLIITSQPRAFFVATFRMLPSSQNPKIYNQADFRMSTTPHFHADPRHPHIFADTVGRRSTAAKPGICDDVLE